jgi:LysR family carnitine catabolism transcriptional activator
MAQGSEQPASWSHAISLRQLRFFVTLAQTGHFSRAADEMAISQPALSAGIRQIESHLGLRLFDRTTHRVALTEAGTALLPHAQRLLTTADNAFIDMREVASRETSTVRIGAIPSAMAAVAGVLSDLAGEMPTVSSHLHDGKSDDLIKGLRKGAYDMVVTVPAGPEPDLGAMPLFDDEMLLVARTDHPLAARDRLAWRALVGQEIVHFAGGSIGDLASAALQQNGLVPSSRYRVDQVDSLYGLVLSGLAVGVMPRLYTRGSRDERLSLTPLERPTVRRRLKLLHRPQLRDEHPLAARFAARLGTDLRQALGR